MLAPLLGVRGEAAGQRVVDLGIALQLSNILLGVRRDARRDRVYLPANRSRPRASRPPTCSRLSTLRGSRPRCTASTLADRYYRSAALGAAAVPLRCRHGVILLGRVNGELGWRAARGALETPSQLARALARHLAGLVATAWHPRTLGLVRPPPHEHELHGVIVGWRGADRATTATT